MVAEKRRNSVVATKRRMTGMATNSTAYGSEISEIDNFMTACTVFMDQSNKDDCL